MIARGALLFLWLATAPVAAAAEPDAQQEEPKPDPAVEQAADVVNNVDVEKLFADKAYAEGILAHVATLRAAERDNPDLEAMLDRLSAIILTALDRDEEAAEIIRRRLAAPAPLPVDHGMALWLAAARQKHDQALAALEGAMPALRSEEERAEMFSVVDETLVYGLIRHFHEQKDKESLFRVYEALVGLNWPGAHLPAMVDANRRKAVEGRLERGDVPGAQSLAAKIVSPSALLPLLVSREADLLFAQADREAAMRAAVSRYDAISAAALAAAPDDLRVMTERAMFLRSIGRDKEAYELLAPRLTDMSKIAEAGEDAFWLVNEAGYALIGAGRPDEAGALMEKLVALGVEEHPMLISMAINRLAMLNSTGRHGEGTRLALDLARESERFASEYGHMWIWSEAACGLAASGDAAGGATWLEKLTARSDVNEAAHMRALLCLDRLDEAEALLIKRLSGDEAEDVLVAIQTYTLGPAFQTPRGKAMEEKWKRVIARPAVQAAVAKVGRILSVPMSRGYWGEF